MKTKPLTQHELEGISVIGFNLALGAVLSITLLPIFFFLKFGHGITMFQWVSCLFFQLRICSPDW